MEASAIRGIAKESIGWSITLSVIMIVAGTLALAAPLLAGVAVTGVVAWGLIVVGFMHIGFAWHVRSIGAHIWEALIAFALLLAGAVMLVHPIMGLFTLTMLLGSYLAVKGLLQIMAGLTMGGVMGRGWLLFDGVVALVLAGMIWLHLPSATVWAVGTLVGVSMVFSGLSRLFLSLAARKVLQTV